MSSGMAFFPFIFMLIPVAVIAMLVIGAVLIVRTIVNRRDVERLSDDEQQQFRRMMDALARMEERVANLETILNQREGERPAGGDPRPAEPQWPFKQ
jgi:phage shock protein B